jgi:hypothetical protein
VRWPDASSGELSVRGPGRSRIDVCFTLDARGNRSQVGVEFRIPDAADRGLLKPVVDQLVVLLRGGRTDAGASASTAEAASPSVG